MPISVKDDTGYKLVYEVWQKIDDVWVLIPTIHYKIGGAWKLVHSKVTPFIYNETLSVNTYGYNLREAAILAGWNTTDPLLATVTIDVGVVVGAENYQNFGFSSGLSFPQASKLTLINNGTIAGMGGQGAPSGKLGHHLAGSDGYRGGTAIFLNLPTILINNGSILAAGGGGGAGGVLSNQDYAWNLRGGAGGGGRGANTSLAGTTEMIPNPIGVDRSIGDDPPTGGTLTVSGKAGNGEGGGDEFGFDASGTGGAGGLLASSGGNGTEAGTSQPAARRFFTFGKGGAAGKAIVGKAYITYQVTGTITGVQE